MRGLAGSEVRPEGMADMPGVCEVSLTRAVVDLNGLRPEHAFGGHPEEIGLGVVVDGRFAADAEVLELGSGRLLRVDLGRRAVILDWLYEPTCDHLRALLADEGVGGGSVNRPPSSDSGFAAYCKELRTRLLNRFGFSASARAILLRLGFRDLLSDIDPHEEAAIRFLLPGGKIARLALDTEGCRLLLFAGGRERDAILEAALEGVFPRWSPFPEAIGMRGERGYQVRLPFPGTMGEIHEILGVVREGTMRLLRVLEPERAEAIGVHIRAMGRRDSLHPFRAAVGSAEGEGERGEARMEEFPVQSAATVPSGRIH